MKKETVRLEGLVTWFTEMIAGTVSEEIIVFIISMMPILELRGGLIAAALFKIPIVKAVMICVIGRGTPI